jgi:hypothetical protein
MNQEIENLIVERAAKLKAIEPHLSLKTADMLSEKLRREQAEVRGQATAQKQENLKREQPQLLPKSFFEMRTLPPKPIRID